AARLDSLEALEDALQVLGRDANSLVAHREARRSRRRGEPDVNGTARAVPERVREQVRDDLIDAQRIPTPDDGPLARERERRPDALRLLREALHCPPRGGGEVHLLASNRELSAGDPRDIEQVLEQPHEVVHLLAEARELGHDEIRRERLAALLRRAQ